MRQLVLKNVLAATDLSPESAEALRTAAELARLAEARLHVVYAAAGPEPHAQRALREHLAGVAPAAAEGAVVHAVPGAPDEVILRTADWVEADVVVLGPHRDRGASGAALGSTADRVVRGAEVPCLVVPRALTLPLSRVVAAVELTDSGRGAVMVALTWGSALRRPLSARTAGEPPTCIDVLNVHDPAEDGSAGHLPTLAEYVASVRESPGAVAGVDIKPVVREDGSGSAGVARAILAYVRESGGDLLVLGTRNLAGAGDQSLGSVSATVVREGAVPVLLVPPPVWRRENRAAALP